MDSLELSTMYSLHRLFKKEQESFSAYHDLKPYVFDYLMVVNYICEHKGSCYAEDVAIFMLKDPNIGLKRVMIYLNVLCRKKLLKRNRHVSRNGDRKFKSYELTMDGRVMLDKMCILVNKKEKDFYYESKMVRISLFE